MLLHLLYNPHHHSHFDEALLVGQLAADGEDEGYWTNLPNGDNGSVLDGK